MKDQDNQNQQEAPQSLNAKKTVATPKSSAPPTPPTNPFVQQLKAAMQQTPRSKKAQILQ